MRAHERVDVLGWCFVGRIQGDLKERTFEFAVSILDLSDQLPNRSKGWELGRQLMRSGMSVGANVREADSAFTDKDFAHRCNIARKEAAETHYWLELSQRCGLLHGEGLKSAIQEADELVRILSTVVKRTREHLASEDRPR